MSEKVLEDVDVKPIVLIQPFWQFLLLSLFSCGWYSKYWSYRVWKQLKEDNELYEVVPVNPIIKGVLDMVYIFSLYRSVLQAAQKHGYIVDYSPYLFSFTYVGIWFISHMPAAAVMVLLFVQFVPAIPLYFAWRHYLENKEAVKVIKTFFTLPELFFLGFCIVYTQNILFMIVNPSYYHIAQERMNSAVEEFFK